LARGQGKPNGLFSRKAAKLAKNCIERLFQFLIFQIQKLKRLASAKGRKTPSVVVPFAFFAALREINAFLAFFALCHLCVS
jgi:hypothetical protein